MKIEIIKMPRKTICLKLLDSENAVLKVPTGTSAKKIEDFLASKKDWLHKNAAKLQEREALGETFNFKEWIYFDGKPLVHTSEIAIGFDDFSDLKKAKEIKKYYLSHFCDVEEFAREISHRTGLKFSEIKKVSSTHIWGSFSSKKIMKLNWKLVILPRPLVEYVICHELCHGLHMNHSPRFWKAVERICPQYKQRKKELAKYAFVLKDPL